MSVCLCSVTQSQMLVSHLNVGHTSQCKSHITMLVTHLNVSHPSQCQSLISMLATLLNISHTLQCQSFYSIYSPKDMVSNQVGLSQSQCTCIKNVLIFILLTDFPQLAPVVSNVTFQIRISKISLVLRPYLLFSSAHVMVGVSRSGKSTLISQLHT